MNATLRYKCQSTIEQNVRKEIGKLKEIAVSLVLYRACRFFKKFYKGYVVDAIFINCV